MPDTTAFYFGRFNVIANYDDKRVFLLRGLRSQRTVQRRNMVWDFLDVGETTNDDGAFIYGYLVKYRETTEEEVAKPELGTIVNQVFQNFVVAKSLFFLHVQTGLVAFHPVSGQIEIAGFRDRFAELFNEAYENLFVDAKIEIIEDEFQIFEVLQQFEKIFAAEVTLHPSNPSNRDRWRLIDDKLKRRHADSYSEVFRSGRRFEDGLQINDDEELRSKIAMAEDGYGEAKVTGLLNGETRTVTTGDNPTRANVSTEDNELPLSILAKLQFAFQRIFQRFRES